MTFGNCLIIGDSYSTFLGYIPEGFAVYYGPARENPPFVPTVEETWWHITAEKTDSVIIQNNSWSGSTVCHTGYGNGDTSKTSSFIHRLDVLIAEGFFAENKIDTVLILGGTNDSWANSPLTPADITIEGRGELFSFIPAYNYLVSGIRGVLPQARIICIANCDIKDEVINAEREIAARYNADFVALSGIDKINGHPTPLGMSQIAEQVMAVCE